MVMITRRPAGAGVSIFHIKIDDTWSTFDTRLISGTVDHYDDAIIAFRPDGFTVDDQGTDGDPNTDGITYTYIVLGEKEVTVKAGEISASVDMNTNKIINLVDPTADQDAATKKYVDDKRQTSCVIAYLTANQTIANATNTKIGGDGMTEVIDRNNDYSNATFTTPVDGQYRVTGRIYYQDIATGCYATLKVYVNDVAIMFSYNPKPNGTSAMTVEVNGILNLAVNDTVDLYAYHQSGGNETIGGGLSATSFHINGPI